MSRVSDKNWKSHPAHIYAERMLKHHPLSPRNCRQADAPAADTPARDSVVDAVREDLLQRSQLGIKKYGVSLDRTDLGLRDWLQHAYEETLDQANYLKRAIIELDRFKQEIERAGD